MEDNNIKNMLGSILNNDKTEFVSYFQDELKSRLANSFIEKNNEMSNNLLDAFGSNSTETNSVDEVFGSKENKTFRFKRPKDMKIFIKAVIDMGLPKRNIKINQTTVSLSGMNKETEQMIMMLSKDMKKSLREEYNNIVLAIQSSYLNEIETECILEDSSCIYIMPEEAFSIIKVHDSLNEENQEKMMLMLSESLENYNNILDFCKSEIDNQEIKNNDN
jgi:hypothetical protein